MALPGATEAAGSKNEWRVRDKLFLWERPLRKGDVEALGDRAPSGPILGVRVADLTAKDAMISEEPEVCFTTPHFNGYPAVLCRLEPMSVPMLEVVVVDAWIAQAPRRLVEEYRSAHPTP